MEGKVLAYSFSVLILVAYQISCLLELLFTEDSSSFIVGFSLHFTWTCLSKPQCILPSLSFSGRCKSGIIYALT